MPPSSSVGEGPALESESNLEVDALPNLGIDLRPGVRVEPRERSGRTRPLRYSGLLTRRPKPAGNTALPVRTAQFQLRLSTVDHIPLPSDSPLPATSFCARPLHSSPHLILPLLPASLSGVTLPRSLPSPCIPLRRSPCLALCRHRASLSGEEAGGGTDDHQILTLAFSRHRMWKWGSHAYPISLPAMARSVRCERGGPMNTQITSCPRRRARIWIWWSPRRPETGIPGSQKPMQGTDKRTPAPRNSPADLPLARQPPSAAFDPIRAVA
jgi:hypothetical protein